MNVDGYNFNHISKYLIQDSDIHIQFSMFKR